MSGRATPHQRASLFFPEVREELTRSWRATYSARLHASSSSALTSVDGTKEKGYGKPRYGPLGQHDRGGLYKSPKRALLEAHLHFSGTPLGMGTAQPVFAQSNSCARQNWTRSQTCCHRATSTQKSGLSICKGFRKHGRSLARQRSTSSPQKTTLVLFEGHGCIGPRLAQPPPLCFSPDRTDHSGHQMNQGTQTQIHFSGPALEEPVLLLSELSQLLTAAPWPITLRRDLLSQVTERCGIPGSSCGLCIFGLSMGARRPPWEHSKHNLSG